MHRKQVVGSVVGAFALGSALILVVQRARAAGIPAKGALTYTGALANPDGTPITAPSKQIGLFTYDAHAGGTIVQDCTVMSRTVNLTGGQFQIQPPAACSAQMKATPDLWLEVQVDGTSLGRAKLGAVPCALEAGHAVSADLATNATNATNAVAADSAADATNGGGIANSIAAAQSPVPKMTEWAAFTPKVATSGGTDVSADMSTVASWRRVGDSIEVMLNTTVNNCAAVVPKTGGGYTLTWTLPSGVTADSTKLWSDLWMLGGVHAFNGSTVTLANVLSQANTAVVAIDLNGASAGGATRATVGVGGFCRLRFTIPVSGWTINTP